MNKKIYKVIFLLAFCLFLFTAWKLFFIVKEYYNGNQEYARIKNVTNTDQFVLDFGMNDLLTVHKKDFHQLKKENPDCVGWITFTDINIDYPIVKGRDNEYYLKHTFYGTESPVGSIFMDFENTSDFSDENTFIYGHNMKDGSMFSQLSQFQEESYLKSKPYFFIQTPKELLHYQIYSCYLTKTASDVYNMKVDKDDKVVTLMTCNSAGDEYRFIIHARQIKAQKWSDIHG